MSGPSVADFSVIDNASYGNPEFQSNPYRQRQIPVDGIGYWGARDNR